MNKVKKIFCRAYQEAFHTAIPVLPYREPHVFSSIRAIGGLIRSLKKTKVFIVTDKNVRRLPSMAVIEESLRKNDINYVIYDKTCENPTVFNVEEALEMYVNTGCEALIGFGGGSSIDCAKAVGARVAYPKASLSELKGLLKVRRSIPTLIAIPTTAGTGSEVTVTAVITDSEIKHKYTMNSFALIPKYAILDPEVTLTLPPSLTATTGMDALTHAVEAYIGRSTTKKTEQQALEAVKLIFNNIENVYEDGYDREARANMLRASYLAGCAVTQSYVGYIHAVAHTLGGRYGVPHGLANAVLMPIVLEAYGECVYPKLHKLGVVAGVSNETDSDRVGARKFISAIRALNKRMGIPTFISGIKLDDITEMAKYADKEANPLYPVPRIMDADELQTVYFKVMDKMDRKSIACS